MHGAMPEHCVLLAAQCFSIACCSRATTQAAVVSGAGPRRSQPRQRDCLHVSRADRSQETGSQRPLVQREGPTTPYYKAKEH